MKRFTLAAIFLAVIATCSYAADSKATLVTQPAYHNMHFYVYKPAGIPSEFYVTYDGYLVYRDAKGVWHYASHEQSGIAKTGYVVGSVIPSVVRLKPYDRNAASVAPIRGMGSANYRASVYDPKSTRISYVPASVGAEVLPELSPNAADWTQNSNFMAIRNWQKSVDRMAVINKPSIPVAWKGDYPTVVYAWTGNQWRQMNSHGKNLSAMNIIRRELYDLTVYTNQLNLLHWTSEDTMILAQYAESWGYKWQGLVIPGRVY